MQKIGESNIEKRSTKLLQSSPRSYGKESKGPAVISLTEMEHPLFPVLEIYSVANWRAGRMRKISPRDMAKMEAAFKKVLEEKLEVEGKHFVDDQEVWSGFQASSEARSQIPL